ncbi:MAG TPA: radical SAM protein [bacterium]|nr:radical SAM protein [bacterium]
MGKGQGKYVFGPVPSRRLGRSLGVDLIPYKTCSYDCVYCQIGRSEATTIERKVYAPARAVIEQVRERLNRGAAPDVITISGSGEPTLHAEIGDVIAAIKGMTAAPVAVLTNGSLLFLPEVRRALMDADIVAPDLDAADPETFQSVNRPHPELKLSEIIAGLRSFAREYRGRLLLEVFLAEGLNADAAQVAKLAAIARGLKSGRVQLNTVSRPPAEQCALAVSREKMAELAALFEPPAEVIADFRAGVKSAPAASGSGAEVLAMLSRRPCTMEDIAAGLSLSRKQARELVDKLIKDKQARIYEQGGRTYYAARGRER